MESWSARRSPPPLPPPSPRWTNYSLLMDTPLSPKRPRQDDPPGQARTAATTPHPRITAQQQDEDDSATMLTANSYAVTQDPHHPPHPHPPQSTVGLSGRSIGKVSGPGPYTAAAPPSCSRGRPGAINVIAHPGAQTESRKQSKE
eukprot:scaffold57302_cov36-Tisochrysis_lutea.AAC.3